MFIPSPSAASQFQLGGCRWVSFSFLCFCVSLVSASSSSSCLGESSSESASVHFYGDCSYSNAVKTVASLLDDERYGTCGHEAGHELQLLLDTSSQTEARAKLKDLCKTGYKNFKNDLNKNITFQINDLPEEPQDDWIQIYGKGALASERLQPSLWRQGSEFLAQDVFYIKRECSRCRSTHQTIIYKRISPVPSKLNIENVMLDDWYSYPSNYMGRDFYLYSNIDDALNDRNRWRRCDYNDRGVGFPRNCGPYGYVGSQWNSLTRGGQPDIAFYAYQKVPVREMRQVQLQWPVQFDAFSDKIAERLRTALLFSQMLLDDDGANALYFISTTMKRVTNQTCTHLNLMERWTLTFSPTTGYSTSNLDRSNIQLMNCANSTSVQTDSIRSFWTNMIYYDRVSLDLIMEKFRKIAGKTTMVECGDAVEAMKVDYTSKVVIPVSEDTIVLNTQPDENFGELAHIHVFTELGLSMNKYIAMLRFSVGNINLASATLYLYLNNIGTYGDLSAASSTSLEIRRLKTNDWIESEVNYNNFMPYSSYETVIRATIDRDTPAKSWIEIDVTDLLQPTEAGIGTWVKVFGKGTLAGETESSLWEQDSSFLSQSVFYIKRECSSCSTSHQTIIYKRITPVPSGLDIKNLMLDDWFNSPSNNLNVDFKLYTSMVDALADTNAWMYCNYNDAGVGFPRDCGPTGFIGGQWNSLSRGGQSNVAFYVYDAPTVKISGDEVTLVIEAVPATSNNFILLDFASRELEDKKAYIEFDAITHAPTIQPTGSPSSQPSSTPTSDPSSSPTSSPTSSLQVQFKGNPCQDLPNGLCSECSGDCDVDADCDGDLRCGQRINGDNAPGCDFGDDPDNLKSGGTDFCFLPRNVPGIVNTVGQCGQDDSDGSYLCGMCEGDCDTDADCEGDLMCFQRTGLEAVPGCEGEGGALDTQSMDVCYNPSM